MNDGATNSANLDHLSLSNRGVKYNCMSLILRLSIITQPELFLKIGQAITVLFISLQGQLQALKKSPYTIKNSIKIGLKISQWILTGKSNTQSYSLDSTMIPRFQLNWYIVLERHVCRDLISHIFDRKVLRCG